MVASGLLVLGAIIGGYMNWITRLIAHMLYGAYEEWWSHNSNEPWDYYGAFSLIDTAYDFDQETSYAH